MLKQISNFGKVLSKEEQKKVLGGLMMAEGSSCNECSSNSDCSSGVCATWSGDCSGPCGCGKYCL